MDFNILGPLEVRDDRGKVSLGGGKQRALLALLLIHPNEALSTDGLIDGLWGEQPPPTAAKIVQNYVSQLRRALGDDRLQTHGRGYAVRVGPNELDVERFKQRLEEGRRAQAAGESAGASQRLREALELWRGPPLADFAYESFAREEIGRLEELHLNAVIEWIDAELALGHHADLIGELEMLVATHPLQERLRGQLMLALYRSGRQAQALQVYQDARRTLVEELGIELSPALRQLEQQILNHDVALRAPQPPRSPPTLARQGHRVVIAGATVLVATAAAAVAVVLSGGSSSAAGIGVNSVGFIAGRGGQVRTQTPVGAAPTSVAFADGVLWVANSSSGTVSRVDPQTRSVLQTITVGNSPSGIAVGGGAVWVANHDDDTVAWVNPQSNTVVREIHVGSGPTAVAYGYGSVWVTNAHDRSVVRINPTSGRPIKTIQADAIGRGIAVGGGFVWVTDESTRTVVQIDPTTNTIAGRPPVGTGPTGIAYSHGSIWVANALDNTVSQIDATTLAVRAVIPVADSPSAVAVSGGSVWVSAEFGARVVRIDPRRGTIVGSIGIGNRPQGLAAGDGGVWVAAQSSGQEHYGGRLVVLDTSGLDSIDPGISNLTTAYALLRTVYDGLTNTRPVGGSAGTQVVPNLAVALPLPTDGGRSYTFHLRAGIRYSNGTPLRAADFRRALERVFTFNGWQASAFAKIVGARRCKPHQVCDLSRGVTVSDPSTLTLRLTAPDSTLLFDLASLVPVPAGTPLRDVGTEPIPSTGAYKIQSYAPGRLLTIVRNPYFHMRSPAARPAGYPDEIVYRVVRNADRAVRDVLAGKADVLTEEVPSQRVSDLAARYPSQLHVVPQQATAHVFMNVRQPPFDDLRVRQALNYALDRKRMTILHGGTLLATPTCQLVPPTTPGYSPYCPYTVDPDTSGEWKAADMARARRLVAASNTHGESVVVWTTSYLHREGLYLVALLQQLGYRSKLHYIPDLTDYFAALAKTPSAQAGLSAWFGAPHAVDILRLFACPTNLYAHFCDRRIDAQLTQLEQEQPSARAAKLAATIDREIVDRAPWAPLYTPALADLTSSRVGNYQASPYGYPLFDQMWVR